MNTLILIDAAAHMWGHSHHALWTSFSTILLYLLLLLDCRMYSFILIDFGKHLLVCKTQSDDGKYGASKADMGGKIR